MQRSILVGSAGSTTGFGVIRSIQEAWGEDIRIVAADTNPPHLVAASTSVASCIQVLPARDPAFADLLCELFLHQRIDTYVPIHDIEIEVAATCRHEGRFPPEVGITAPELSVVTCCNDKLASYRALATAALPTPFTASIKVVDWQPEGWLAKPRVGVGSIGVTMLRTADDFAKLQAADSDFVVQAPCHGSEITIDTFRSRNSDFLQTVARERIETKAGVCSKARLYHDPELHELASGVAEALGLRGAFNFQVMRQIDGSWGVIDINPRTGGATSMCRAVGINFAAANLADLWDEDFERFLPGLDHERYVMRQPTEFVTR